MKLSGKSWNRLYRDWLPASGYAAPFETYLKDKKEAPVEELQKEIQLPIQWKNETLTSRTSDSPGWIERRCA
jgi:GyrI-like small molecule binding domain